MGRRDAIELIVRKIREKGVERFAELLWSRIEEPMAMFSIKHENRVMVVAWSPDGSKLATGGWDNTVQIWDMRRKKVIATIQHKNRVLAVSCRPDGSMLATGSLDYTAQIWDLCKTKVVATIPHRQEIYIVSWSPDGSKLATVSAHHDAQIFDVKKNKVIAILHKNPIYSVSWSPDGSKLAMGSLDNAQIWQMGGTVIDWAVSAICSGSEKEGLEAFLALEECADLEGLCSTSLLLGLCHGANKVRLFSLISMSNFVRL